MVATKTYPESCISTEIEYCIIITMDDNIKFVAAYLHLMEVVNILDGSENDVSETLVQLAQWLRNRYGITDESISEMIDIEEEISRG